MCKVLPWVGAMRRLELVIIGEHTQAKDIITLNIYYYIITKILNSAILPSLTNVARVYI